MEEDISGFDHQLDQKGKEDKAASYQAPLDTVLDPVGPCLYSALGQVQQEQGLGAQVQQVWQRLLGKEVGYP